MALQIDTEEASSHKWAEIILARPLTGRFRVCLLKDTANDEWWRPLAWLIAQAKLISQTSIGSALENTIRPRRIATVKSLTFSLL